MIRKHLHTYLPRTAVPSTVVELGHKVRYDALVSMGDTNPVTKALDTVYMARPMVETLIEERMLIRPDTADHLVGGILVLHRWIPFEGRGEIWVHPAIIDGIDYYQIDDSMWVLNP